LFSISLEELSSDFQNIADSTDYDVERITEIENRLSVLFKLEKKHFVSSDRELIQIQQELQKNLKGHENLEQRIINLEKKLLIQEKELFEIGKILTDRRLSAAAVFEDNIHKLLVQLSMSNARIKVDIQEISKITASGTDQLKFLFASNKGSRLEEIKGIVSGGEMSRLALCIKSLIANAMTLPTLIFDEIDAGVSGEVALQMGNIMKELASKHQVISITHSPQIAAKANSHYFVQKVDAEERTLTTVSLLEENDRIIEIAKMLSGNPPSESAKANAIELLTR
jgi:DNA repair protein RecN (Recombination protein N)